MKKRRDTSCDAIFTRNMITCIAGILICMVSLCATTFAWFTEDVNSSANVIKTASYDIKITVVGDEADGAVEYTVDGYNLSADANVYELSGGKVYTVTLEAEGNAERGFCMLIIGDDKTLYTECISAQSGNSFTFKLGFAATTRVQFVPSWGETSHEVTIKNGGEYVENTEESTAVGDTSTDGDVPTENESENVASDTPAESTEEQADDASGT